MSNYLDRIASKISNQASVVRPRLAARFEPLADGQLAVTSLNTIATQTRAEQPNNAVLTTPQDSVRPEADSVPAKSDRQSTTISGDRASQLSPPPPAISLDFDRTEPVVGKLPEKDTPEIEPFKSVPSVRATPSERVAPPTIFDPPHPQQPIKNDLLTKESPTREVRLPQAKSSAIFSTSNPVNPPAPSPTVTSTSVTNYLPAVVPTKASSNSANKTFIPPIQVNIGQIVIRAIAPKPPKQKSSPSRPPKPSLEQYLQARSDRGASGERGRR